MKKKTITLYPKDFIQKKTIMDEFPERYRRRKNREMSETDKKVIRYLKKAKGSTINQTAIDCDINYKTMRDVYRRLEDAEIVKFIKKILPSRAGGRMVETMVFSLTPKFSKVAL